MKPHDAKRLGRVSRPSPRPGPRLRPRPDAVCLGLTVLLSVILLWASVVPGRLQSAPTSAPGFLALVFAVLIALPAAGVWVLLACVAPPARRITRRLLNRVAPAWPAVFVSLILLAGTYVTLRKYVPRRVVFQIYATDFGLLARSGVDHSGPVAPPRRIGPYRIEDVKADERGGLFVKVHEHPDFIDTVSGGFAYRPNATGTPFGRSGYRRGRLSGDWYWFVVSDDYH